MQQTAPLFDTVKPTKMPKPIRTRRNGAIWWGLCAALWINPWGPTHPIGWISLGVALTMALQALDMWLRYQGLRKSY